jgi:acyl-coenzyme A thioesterase PaaI-like protein
MGDDEALQERYAPSSVCFGCGPANANGLRIRSVPAVDGPDEVVATWRARPEHEAFVGVLNGGICGTLLDCHMNWAAVWRLLRDTGARDAPDCVTAELAIRFLRPTPTDRPITIRGRAVESDGTRVVVEGSIEVDGTTTATARGTFVAVGPGHPAFSRWRNERAGREGGDERVTGSA